ncbi:MAG: preprotein translocase subunit YajC [Alphaproteobacteria bacterium]|nr:preprotein translocase subunit YajC [Alphaproteobacteria bacterium]
MQATPAPAGAADQGPMGSLATTLLFPIAMIAIFYFLLIRPQNQRAKKHKEMLGSLKKGDTVVTSGGIIGKAVKITDDEVTVDAGEGVKLRLVRGMIVEVRKLGDAAPANDVKAS